MCRNGSSSGSTGASWNSYESEDHREHGEQEQGPSIAAGRIFVSVRFA